ncbi:hypothetical protein [Halomarina litorea]|uniref:hypothetical protein n=1 Tax=Halomarina litorea TaxID=2961595 RepID=UPI0020C4B93E|nr:hypothetical protein [Halomarina sp. BCD28]
MRRHDPYLSLPVVRGLDAVWVAIALGDPTKFDSPTANPARIYFVVLSYTKVK